MDFTIGLPLLILIAISVAIIHTLSGPDHYLPFIVLSFEKKWSAYQTIMITLICGFGHVLSSVGLGYLGLWMGTELTELMDIEEFRGNIASWLLFIFGFSYLIWGLWNLWRKKTEHIHFHSHNNGISHSHHHQHLLEHSHIHSTEKKSLTPWVLFVIFIFGPCEPLIPIVMGTHLHYGISASLTVSFIFTFFTLLVMVVIVFIGRHGLQKVKFSFIEKYATIITGGSLSIAGFAMVFLGL